MIALFIITSVLFVVVVCVILTVVVITGLITSIDCVVMSHFLLSFVKINAVSLLFWVEENGRDTWETGHYV